MDRPPYPSHVRESKSKEKNKSARIRVRINKTEKPEVIINPVRTPLPLLVRPRASPQTREPNKKIINMTRERRERERKKNQKEKIKHCRTSPPLPPAVLQPLRR